MAGSYGNTQICLFARFPDLLLKDTASANTARLFARCSLTAIALWAMYTHLQRASDKLLFAVVIMMTIPIIAVVVLLIPPAGR